MLLVAVQPAPDALTWWTFAIHQNGDEASLLSEGGYAGMRLYRYEGSDAAVNAPVPDGAEWLNPPESLSAYAARRRWEILDQGRIQVGPASVPTNDYTQGKLTGGALKATRNPGYSIKNWKVGEGVFVTLDAQTIIAFADAVEARVQEMFDREAAVAAGIKAGTLTAEAQAEAILAAPSQVPSS